MFKHISLALLSVVAFAQITPIPGGGGSGGSGTVTNIATGCGLSGGPITGTGTIVSRYVENAQVGTTYTVLTGDCGKAVTFSNAGAIAVTLPQAGVSFPDGWFFYAKNIGAGDVTITPTTSTISGAASITLSLGEFALITSNGTNYEAQTNRITVDSALSITRSRTAQQIGAGATIATLSGTQTLTNKDLSSATNSIGPNAIKAYVAGGGTAQAQTVTLSPALPAYAAGGKVCWLPVAANSATAPTLNVNGLGAKTITKLGTTALAASDLTTTAVACAIYDGTQYQLQNPQVAASSGSGFTLFNASFGANQYHVVNGTTKYFPVTGTAYPDVTGINTAFDTAIPITNNATLSKLCITATYGPQAATGSLVFTLVKDSLGNGTFSDTALVVTIAANDPVGLYCDNSNTVSLTATDRISVKAQNNASSDTTYFSSVSLQVAY